MKHILLYCGKRILMVACGMAFMMLAVISAHAQVTVEASIDSLELLIGEQTKVRLEVSMDAGRKLRLPVVKDTLVRGVEVLDIAKPDTQLLNENKRWLISQEYTVTSFDSALYYLPPFQVVVDNKPYKSKALALKVYSIPVDTLHPDQFFGPKTIHEVPLTWEDLASLVYSVLLLLVFGVVVVFLVVRYRDNKPIIRIIRIEPKLPPHLAAMKKIESIKADKDSRKDDPKQYYTDLTDVIRNYIKERFGFNAMEMTSSEIIGRLQQVEDKTSIDDLRALFATADLVKFAKHSPLINENDMNLVTAIDFINQTKEEEVPGKKEEPKEIKVEEKRSKRGRIILLCSIGVAGVAALVTLYLAIRHIIDLFF